MQLKYDIINSFYYIHSDETEILFTDIVGPFQVYKGLVSLNTSCFRLNDYNIIKCDIGTYSILHMV